MATLHCRKQVTKKDVVVPGYKRGLNTLRRQGRKFQQRTTVIFVRAHRVLEAA